MFQKISFKIKTSILTVFIVVILFVLTTVLMINHKSSNEFALLTTQKVFDRLSDKIINQISQYDFLSINFINLSNKIDGIDDALLLEKEPKILPVFIEHISNSSYVYGIYIAFENDQFYQVINLSVSNDIKTILKLKDEGRWLIRKHLNVDGKIIRHEQLLDKNLQIISTKKIEVNYKPTARPWYKQAIQSNSIIKTQPYIFTSLKQPGVTYGKTINQINGSVLALDISLSKLEELLSKQDLVEGSAAFIFKENGEILSQFDNISKNTAKNINKKYPDIFIKNHAISEVEQQKIITINGIQYIKYTTLLTSDFETHEYLSIISPLKVIMKPYQNKIYETLQTTILLILIFVLPIIFYAVRLIVRPILALQNENEKIKNKDFKNIKPINSFMLEISDLSQSMVLMAHRIKEYQEDLEKKITQRTKEIENLLNNAGQGFLSFNKNMHIGIKYSNEAKHIFDQEIAGLNITHLLYEDAEKQTFLQTTLENILAEDEMKQEIFISLLQKEFIINGKFIEVEYKVLDQDNFMMILTNITDKKELANKIKKEQQLLKMVVEIVTTQEQFNNLKEEYDNFILTIDEYKSLEKLSDLRKIIHTYKGVFAQKEMLNIVENLHNFETEIDCSIKQKKLSSIILNINTKTMKNWIEEDVVLLKKILGETFFTNQNTIIIDKKRITQLQNHINTVLKKYKATLENQSYEDIKNIKNEIKALKYKTVYTLVHPYEKLVDQLATKLEKSIHPMKIECDTIYLPNKYNAFFHSLVHIFRNCVDHGIEDIETRYEKGKEEFGTISSSIKAINGFIDIQISDDGAGVDIEKIKQLAIDKKLYKKKEINKFNESKILMILFEDSFSTTNTITDISGRGVGLSSIIDELDKLGGTIKVENNFGKGMKFKFLLPYKKGA